MGNKICGSKPNIINLPGHDPPADPPNFPIQRENNNDEDFHQAKLTEKQNKDLKDFQDFNFHRLKKAFDSDMKLFILNNTLMCIQFFDNFDRSQGLAKDFKWEKEKEMNEMMSAVMNEGIMTGERTVFLLHGMGEILNKNYIYRHEKQEQFDTEVYNNLGNIYKQKAQNSSYMVEGILPLDFFLNYDNYKVYTEFEWQKSQNNDYDSVIEDPPLNRVCIEEPDRKNRIPIGFVRLHCEETSRRENAQSTESESKFVYAESAASEYFLDGASDMKSSIYASTISSDDGDDDSMINLQPGQKVLRRVEKKASNTSTSSKHFHQHRDSVVGLQSSSNVSSRLQSPADSFTPKSYQAKAKHLPDVHVSGVLPEIIVDDAASTSSHRNAEENPLPIELSRPSELRLPSSPQNYRRDREKTPPGMNKNTSRSPPESVTFPPTHKDHPSSGYESLSASSTAFSRASSAASTEVPVSRRQLLLKGLWEYAPKQKSQNLSSRSSQIPPNCIIEVQIEKMELDDVQEEDEDTSESDSVDSDSDTSRSHTSSISQESKYFIRYYLNSTRFSDNFCSDFNLIGEMLGNGQLNLDQAQVLGATIRCSVTQESPNDDVENYKVLYTFTPTLLSKHWTRTSQLWFTQRLRPTLMSIESSPERTEESSWLNNFQINNVVDFGWNLIPQGYRPVKFFNAHQSMEWQLNFCQSENFLMNTFKNVHWRIYIFSSILFRAFIAPMGPKGLGLEHIRNIIYKMCEENFLFWNDEEPGFLLRKVLDKLYESLGKRHMGNFFIEGYDMLKSCAPENILFVQAGLKRIRENLINHCIHSFRNLTCLRDSNDFYPTADFKKLYKLVTCSDKELFLIMHPNLGPGDDLNPDSKKDDPKRHGKKGKKKRKTTIRPPSANDETFQRVLGTFDSYADKNQRRLREKYAKIEKENNKRRKESRERRRADTTAKNIIPQQEKRKSIDLDKPPVDSFSAMRSVMITDFYIQHFFQMASKALEFSAFSLAAMYTLHVENLCRLLETVELETTPIDKGKIDEYMKRAKELRRSIGPRIAEYVTDKLPPLELPNGTSTTLLNHISPPSTSVANNNYMDNFRMNRRLPTPPLPTQASSSKTSSISRIYAAGAGSSLLHFPAENHAFSHTNFESPSNEEFELPLDRPSRPRRQTIKYIQEDMYQGYVPSATRFPRLNSSRSGSQSVTSVTSLQHSTSKLY